MGNGSREMPKKRGEGARGNVFVQTDTIQVKRTSRLTNVNLYVVVLKQMSIFHSCSLSTFFFVAIPTFD